jgi:cytochrome c
MKKIPLLSLSFFAMLFLLSCSQRSEKPRVLVFSKTAGFHHSSIPAGQAAIAKLGAENGFDVDTTSNAEMFNEDTLKKYAAVVFLSTTGDLLNNYEEADFERYIQAGGGYVGIHAAADAEYDWGWYGRLVGGYFLSHPKIQQAKLNVVDASNISTKHLPKEWTRTDEWYNYKKLNPDVKVLLTIDESSYQGGENGKNHPMAWYHDYDGGRAFYTELGHTDESYSDENYLKHILGGIKYAIGDNAELNYAKATTQHVPDEDRFTKTMLTQGTLFEPTEMTILPNFDVLIAQRRGEIMMFSKKDSSIKQVGHLDVYYKTHTPGVNAEEGVLGLQKDPDFEKNHYIYIFYSPVDTSVNRLSRFKFENDSLITSSEKVILQFYSQREICCHTGGSIAFGEDHMLFLSTGDNSTPFDEPKQKYVSHGFAPLDDRPGHTQYDARRSAGNTNDLRGKILRIKIKDDGSYDIPEGNLFPGKQPETRPEIYVMGNRNPYRIQVDKKTGFLYWGEVGPDAGSDSLDTRGPRGYDELNQARKAGYFGWPFFVGNNYPYKQYDYASGKTGASFDPNHPVNNSKNNTGLQNLPAVSPAFIWYPYAESPDFPQVGTGGRNAMAGPVYYTDQFPAETRYPEYYNGKLFIYDWIRGWIKVVTMRPNGDFDKMEPFMKSTKLFSPIDMEVGPDGKLYILEYGSGWFSKNPDAGLARIDFNGGNRAPKIAGISSDKASGALPFTVNLTAEARDPEKKPLKYVWNLGNGVTKETTEPKLQYTFDKAGDYAISLTATDEGNLSAKSNTLNVYAGNETPVLNVSLAGNKSFYFPGKPVQYKVTVSDKDDASPIDPASLVVSASYVEGTDKAGAPLGHLVMTDAAMGKNIMLSLDCKTCHQIDTKSIGPAFTDVAKRYEKDPNAVNYLAHKIIKGGGGVWGETAMSAHPDLPESDAKQIVAWIQTLAGSGKNQKSLPAEGTVAPTLNMPAKPNGVLVISASYTDKGGVNIKPLTGQTAVGLRSSKVTFESASNLQGFTSVDFNGSHMMILPKDKGWFSIDSIDLTDVSSATMITGWQNQPQFGYTVELHLDKPDGQLIGSATIPGVPNGKQGFLPLKTAITPVTDGKPHNLYFVTVGKNPKQEPNVAALQSIEFAAK